MTEVEKPGEQKVEPVEISTSDSRVEIRDSTENSTSDKFWVCPDCGKKLTIKYKSGHKKHCRGKPKLKDIQKAKEAAKELDSKPKSELLSQRFEKPMEDPGVAQITDDPKLNFYLQIAIVVGIVVTSLWVVYRSITNATPQPQQYEQQIDLGFTDARGVYYGPGEYHH